MASRRIADILLLALLSALVFLNAQPDEFVWESSDFVSQPAVTGDLRSALRLFLPSGWQEYGKATLEDYRPLATVTYHFDHALWGRTASGYIWTNAAIHVLNLLFVYLLAATLLASPCPITPSLHHSTTPSPHRPITPSRRHPAAVAALLFAFHPVHAEAVNWVENRSLLLGTTFFLASTILFIRSECRRWLIAASLVTFLASLLALELNVVLPAFLVAYALCDWRAAGPQGPRRSLWPSLAATVPFWLLAVAFFVFRHLAFGPGDTRKLVAVPFTLLTKIATVLETLAIYVSRLAFPIHLSADTPFVIPAHLTLVHVFLALAGLVLLVLAYSSARRGNVGLPFALLWLLLALAPVSNVIFLATRPIAEQRLYLPTIGLALVCGALVAAWHSGVQRRAVAEAALARRRLAAAALLLLSAASIHRNFVWRSDYALWRDTAIASPDRWRAWLNLGNVYSENGLERRAAQQFERSLSIVRTPQACSNLARIRRQQGRLQDAAVLLRSALQLQSTPENHANLAAVLVDRGDLKGAETEYRKALEAAPDMLDAQAALGNVCRLMARLPEALELYDRVLRASPNRIEVHHNAGVVRKRLADEALARGDRDTAHRLLQEAKAHFKAVLEAEPANSPANYMLGAIYEAQGDRRSAFEHYLRAQHPGTHRP